MALVASLLGVPAAYAQLSPPGLGPTKTASWTALGVRQALDAVGRRESVTYAGMGTISQPDGYNPFADPAIFVLNEEVYDRFHENWSYSVALSYRRQYQYEDEAPFALADPAIQHELRLYGRISGAFEIARLKLVNTLRPEIRSFFADGGPASEALQFRFRLRSQATVRLDPEDTHRLVMSAEVLTTVAKERAEGQTTRTWSSLDYSESRFCLYYSWNGEEPFSFDVGYMNDLMGRGASLADAHYLAFDFVWKNPFGAPHRR